MQSQRQESALDGMSDFDDSVVETWSERWDRPSRFEDLTDLIAELHESRRLVSKLKQQWHRSAHNIEERLLVREVYGLFTRHEKMIKHTIRKHTGVTTQFRTALARFRRHVPSDYCDEIADSFYEGIEFTIPDATYLRDQSAKDEYGSLMKALSLRSKSVYSTNLARLFFSRGPGGESARQLISNWDQSTTAERQGQFQELKLEMDGRKLYDTFSRVIPKFAATSFPDSKLLREVAGKYGTASDDSRSVSPVTGNSIMPFLAACETAEKNCGEMLTREDRELLTGRLESFIIASRAPKTRTGDVIHDVWTVAVAESFYHHVPKEKSKDKSQRKSNTPHPSFGPPRIPACTDRSDEAGVLNVSDICRTQ